MTDNVRKIFDMLGVEPNEKFKVEGNGDTIYYINKLLYVYRDEGIECGCLSYLINGCFKIVKLPKEPKKKKLRDLTPEEFDKWQSKNCGNDNCNNKCVFNKVICYGSYSNNCWVHNKDLYSDKFLDQEIEVE